MKKISRQDFHRLIDELINAVVDSEHHFNNAEFSKKEEEIKNKINTVISFLPSECFLQE